MEAFLGLAERFGPDLTLTRTNSDACFTFDGQCVTVECARDGGVRVRFCDRPARDLVMERSWVASYRTLGPGYALTEIGCERLARDVSDFFGGVREPRFTFESLE